MCVYFIWKKFECGSNGCLSEKFYHPILKMRTSNHRLPVETGRHYGISYDQRKCSRCHCLGDEYHYAMECPTYSEYRKILLPACYIRKPSYFKFQALLNSDNYLLLQRLSKLFSIILNNDNY